MRIMNKKNQFKIYTFGMFAMIISILLSCSNDDGDDGNLKDSDLVNKAIGTWMCTQSIDTGWGTTYQNLMVGKEVTIYKNGTYTSTAQSFGYTGTYSVNGNQITAKSNNGGTFVITVNFSDDTMTWNGTASNGVTFRYVFLREVDTNHNITIPITIDKVAGTSWSVKSYTIERGSNSSIQNGKIIQFNKDGSCVVFHSMENAWRISGGRIETYYRQTNEPMFVYTLLSQNDNEITVRMNGTLDDELQATLGLVMKKI